jgi:1-acyl-sn-glycerol-3-phosphate acyltransferase
MTPVREKLYLAFGLWFHFWLLLITLIGATSAIAFSLVDRSGVMAQHAARCWGRALTWMGRIPVQVQGRENLVPGQNYVFAANHRSNFDIYVLLAFLPGIFAFVAKKSLFKIPIFGQALHSLGCVPVDRENRQQAIRSLNDAAARLRGGKSMIIFPEGTRATTPELLPFKKGGFVMAMKAGLPVVPVAVNGTRFIQPRASFRVRPGPVRVVIKAPIFPENYRRKEELMDAVQQSLAAAYDPDFPYGPGGADG